MDRLNLMLRYFDSPAHLARFLGVSPMTLWRWMTERTQPDAAARRLMDVMERLELHAPDLHAYLVDEARLDTTSSN